MNEQTENHDYNTPEAGTLDWHEELNDNFEALDTGVEIRDDSDNMDEYEPKEGAKFLATDTGEVYIGDGTDWGSPIGSLNGGDASEDVPIAGRYLEDDGGERNFNGPAEWENAGDTETNEASGSNASVAGGRLNAATGDVASVGSGSQNDATAEYARVSGGRRNDATGRLSTVGGGEQNEASGAESTIGGGAHNEVTGLCGTIAGGGPTNRLSRPSTSNRVYDDYGTIGGGGDNQTGVEEETDGEFATVAGGEGNLASANHATIGGGQDNEATDRGATVGGGRFNEASGEDATVGGGNGNTASGEHSTVLGGQDNTAGGSYSVVAGRNAESNSDGQFVFTDSSPETDTFPTGISNRFYAMFDNGYRFLTDTTDGEAGVWMGNGATSWSSISSVEKKTDIVPVDAQDILEKVADLDVSTWTYKWKTDTLHMGPMAGEFFDAFGLGDSDEGIQTIDADGVLFAAIQGAAEKLDEKDERIDAQAERIATLEARNDDLEARLATLEETVRVSATPADD